MKTNDDDTEERILILMEKLEYHLERLMIIDRLIKSVSDDKELGEEIRKLIK